MLGNIANVVIYVLLAVSLLLIGWNEPLRYKFLTPRQVAAEERIYHPLPKPKPDYREWRPQGTALDRGAYRQSRGEIIETEARRKGLDTSR